METVGVMDGSQKDGWPFVPNCLSGIMDSDTLAVIESGCCERIGRPLTILDHDPRSGGFSRIESIEERQRYAGFCRMLRSADVPGGDQACMQADIEEARRSWQTYLDTGDPYRVFACHLGLLETTHVIRLRGNPVALLFCGQYRSPSGPDSVQERVRRLGTGPSAKIRPSDAMRRQLLALTEEIQPLPADARELLEREVAHIERIAEAELERRKREAELAFLNALRQATRPGAAGRAQLEKDCGQLLALVKSFCCCSYLIFFGGTQPDQNVLAPLAQAGIPDEIARNLPHFNRRKAGLLTPDWEGTVSSRALQGAGIGKGIRGQNADFFSDAVCAIPTSLGAQYHGVLVFGRFEAQVDWQLEQSFLAEVTHTVGSVALVELATIGLKAERQRWQDTEQLLTHQLGTALTPITTKIGRAKSLAGKPRVGPVTGRLDELLVEAEDLALLLAEGAKKTVRGSALLVERKDLFLERYPLSVLVENVASGFVQKAAAKETELVVEDSVERLPHAMVDVARLTIALANLIENGVKYSHPGRTIYIRAALDPAPGIEQTLAVIEVDDLGYEIPTEEQERIFEHGARGLMTAKLGHIPGSGLGLWEARAVVDAHGGEITVRCRPTGVVTGAGRGYHVVFAVRIPLEQKGTR